MYRPPYSHKNPQTIKTFIQEFEIFLSEIEDLKGCLLILGDFNINNFESSDIYVDKFLTLVKRNDMHQFVTTKTHIQGGLIDLVLAEGKMRSLLSVRVDETFNTDHYPIILELKGVMGPKYDKVMETVFGNELRREPIFRSEVFSKLKVEDLIDRYNSSLEILIENNCPAKIKKYRTSRIKSLWFNSELQKLKQKRRQKERMFLKSPTEINKFHFSS